MFDIADRDIKFLPGVGPQRAALLEKELNIRTYRDLLYYFPYNCGNTEKKCRVA